jgi:hypothetical protein
MESTTEVVERPAYYRPLGKAELITPIISRPSFKDMIDSPRAIISHLGIARKHRGFEGHQPLLVLTPRTIGDQIFVGSNWLAKSRDEE